MKIVMFGLTISSSWGNGHATLLRGLFKALVARGHRIVFFERDVPYYAHHRDMIEFPGVELRLYTDWNDVHAEANDALRNADVGIITSYCPDGIAATNLLLDSNVSLRVLYDLDTPVTLDAWKQGQSLSYIGERGLVDFDLVLSYTGGEALADLQRLLGARRVVPLYGSVDPDVHRPVDPLSDLVSDLSYLGTYADDRQSQLDSLFIGAARRLPSRRFLIGGSKYPHSFPWLPNIWYIQHVPPASHSKFYCSSLLTLNLTRATMARMGYCPSGRLFEAAACGTAIVSDSWNGLSEFFEPGEEVLVVHDVNETIEAITLSRAELRKIGAAARQRALDQHTAVHRAIEMELIFEQAFCRGPSQPGAEMTIPGDAGTGRPGDGARGVAEMVEAKT
jgi:spore maturation protein CgeB